MEVKREWIAQLQALTGRETDTIRWNTSAQRFEFILTEADGVPRSQFWCEFDGDRDPVTGLKPFRALTDATMRVALANLERTFVGNPYDGNGTPAREVGRRYFFNKRLQEQRYRDRGREYAEFIWDNRRRIRDAGAGPLVSVAQEIR
jgi:hypothetical protein